MQVKDYTTTDEPYAVSIGRNKYMGRNYRLKHDGHNYTVKVTDIDSLYLELTVETSDSAAVKKGDIMLFPLNALPVLVAVVEA
jgi:hypothetical protein